MVPAMHVNESGHHLSVKGKMIVGMGHKWNRKVSERKGGGIWGFSVLVLCFTDLF